MNYIPTPVLAEALEWWDKGGWKNFKDEDLWPENKVNYMFWAKQLLIHMDEEASNRYDQALKAFFPDTTGV